MNLDNEIFYEYCDTMPFLLNLKDKLEDCNVSRSISSSSNNSNSNSNNNNNNNFNNLTINTNNTNPFYNNNLNTSSFLDFDYSIPLTAPPSFDVNLEYSQTNSSGLKTNNGFMGSNSYTTYTKLENNVGSQNSNVQPSNQTIEENRYIDSIPTLKSNITSNKTNSVDFGLKANCPNSSLSCNGNNNNNNNNNSMVEINETFSCPVCCLNFKRKNSMKRHVLIHINNIRPYSCLYCEKSFYRSDIYKRHLRSKRCRLNRINHECHNNKLS